MIYVFDYRNSQKEYQQAIAVKSTAYGISKKRKGPCIISQNIVQA